MTSRKTVSQAVLAAALFAVASFATQAQTPPPYGAPISIDIAKKAAAGAVAEARKNNWGMVIAITDGGGHLVYLERMDGTQYASVDIAVRKAQSAASYRRPSKVFEDAVAAGRNAVLGLTGAMPIEGGVPIVIGGSIVGAIGASGGTAPQDGVAAAAGLNALK